MLDIFLAREIRRGTMVTNYKGVPALICSFDLVIYRDILWKMRPGTILEFGSYKGGSALWLADTLGAFWFSETRLITLDIAYMYEFHDPRMEFGLCNVVDIKAFFSEKFMATLARPPLVIEDFSQMGAHVLSVMEFFHKHSAVGDYLIVEDGMVSVIMDEAEFGGGPFEAIYTFLAAYSDTYYIDRERCDRSGCNVTWNIDGYIRRIA